jgi:hypothetical protein
MLTRRVKNIQSKAVKNAVKNQVKEDRYAWHEIPLERHENNKRGTKG